MKEEIRATDLCNICKELFDMIDVLDVGKYNLKTQIVWNYKVNDKNKNHIIFYLENLGIYVCEENKPHYFHCHLCGDWHGRCEGKEMIDENCIYFKIKKDRKLQRYYDEVLESEEEIVVCKKCSCKLAENPDFELFEKLYML